MQPVLVHESLSPWWMFAGGLLAGLLFAKPLRDWTIALGLWLRARRGR